MCRIGATEEGEKYARDKFKEKVDLADSYSKINISKLN